MKARHWVANIFFQIVITFAALSAKSSDFGSTGLVTLPSARTMDDGSLAVTAVRSSLADIINVSFQITPSIESTFRYTIFDPRSDRLGSRDNLRDRSYGVKWQFFEGNKALPTLAIGARDILGTGVWSGEYLVASKYIAGVDLTAGLGWGRYAGRGAFSNPFSLISDKFKERPSGQIGGIVGGEVRSKSFFRGDAALFGGLRYKLTNFPLEVLLEYSSDTFDREVALGSLARSHPLNYAVKWQLTEGVSLSVSRQQAQFWSLNLRAEMDAKVVPERRYEMFYSVLDEAGRARAPNFLDLNAWYDRLLFDVERSGLKLHSFHKKSADRSVTFVLTNERYGLWADALHQFFLLSELHLPKDMEVVAVEILEDNFRGPRIEYKRRTVGNENKNNFAYDVRTETKQRPIYPVISIKPGASLNRAVHATDFGFPKLAIGADFALRTQLMDPDEPLKHQLYVKATARLAISSNMNIWSSYSLDVSNDFNTRRPSDSVLPRVRTEMNRYLTEGKNGIDSFYVEYGRSTSPVLHTRAYAGLLEDMFGGMGGEALYQPFDSRWALGANINWVKQRGYDKRFAFQDYEVVTGHISAFYASPWYNLDFGLHIGRYLAEDLGVTYEARRTFDNGFSIGAFFTRTNISPETFGEGSFDKGLFLRVPVNLFTSRNSRTSFGTLVRSIERDGGRRLEGAAGNLWWNRRAIRYDALSHTIDRMIP